MRAVVQRVRSGRVDVDGAPRASIGSGAVVLLGVEQGDTLEDASWMASKLSRLRIFARINFRLFCGVRRSHIRPQSRTL